MVKPKGPTAVSTLVNTPRGRITSLMNQWHEQQSLLTQVRRLLPDFVAAHCTDCVLENGRINIYTNGSAAANRLRYFVPTLLQQLSSRLSQPVDSIKVKIQPESSPSKGPTRKPNDVSQENQGIIKKTADCIEDPELSSALAKLADTIKRHSK